MVFNLFRIWLTKAFGSRFQSSQKVNYKSPSGGFRSIGGGDYASRKGCGPASMDPIMTFTESEERMVEGVKMQSLKTYPAPASDTPSSSTIVVSNQIDITHETRSSHTSDQAMQNTREAW